MRTLTNIQSFSTSMNDFLNHLQLDSLWLIDIVFQYVPLPFVTKETKIRDFIFSINSSS